MSYTTLIVLQESDKSNMESKLCNRCKEVLDIACFGVNKQMHDSLHPTCKNCVQMWRNVPKGTKRCSRCEDIKSKSDFKTVGKSKRKSRYCNPCNLIVESEQAEKKLQQDRDYYEREHDVIREQQVWNRLRIRYGVTREQWEAQYEAQGGLCAICEKAATGTSRGNRLHVDHSHETGQVRGLLCAGCNTHLGILEKTEWRAKAEAYLESWDNS